MPVSVGLSPHPKPKPPGKLLRLAPMAIPWLAGCFGPVLMAEPEPGATIPSSETVDLHRSRSEGSFCASWYGVPGRTYFPQVSDDMVHWSYVPELKNGAALLQQGMEPNARGRQFIRLTYSDQPAITPAKADFDGDGIPNLVELQNGGDPLDAASSGGTSEAIRVKLYSADLSDQQLQNGQSLSSSPTGSAKVSLSGTTTAQVSAGLISWGAGSGNRGLLSPAAAQSPGRAAISTLRTPASGDVSNAVGFTANGSLSGLKSVNGFSTSIQLSQDGRYNFNRIISCFSSSSEWSEMNYVAGHNDEFRTMVRCEVDGFSTWVQGGIFNDMGAVIDSAVWFPVSRWKGTVPAGLSQAGTCNFWPGTLQTREFSDIANPTVDATSALLDHERNKLGLHVPTLLKLPGGAVLAAWQNATGHESADCVLKMALRNSRGVWGPASTILDAGADGTSNNGPTLHQIGNQIWLTYQSITDGVYTVRKRVVSLNGDTISLSTPTTLFNQGLLLNHLLTLPSGRIIACWHTQQSNWKNRISYSDDHGQTWKAAKMPEFPQRAGEGFALLEADGTLASYWRTDQLSIHRSTSGDGGLTWTALAPTAIPSANMPTQGLMGSRAAGYKRPSDGKLVIVGNDSTTQREKLAVWLVNNGVVEAKQSLLPWKLPAGRAEGLQYPDIIVHPDDSMTVIFSRWQGGGLNSAELHSAINTFKVPATFE